MKKLLTIGLLCFLVGCFKSSPVDDGGRYLAERKGTNEFNVILYPGNGDWTFHYIMVDGHEYIVMAGAYRSGLAHSPKCPCQKSNVEIVLPLNTVTNEMTQVVPL